MGSMVSWYSYVFNFWGSFSSIACEPLAPQFGPEELQIEEEVPEPKLQEPALDVSGQSWSCESRKY